MNRAVQPRSTSRAREQPVRTLYGRGLVKVREPYAVEACRNPVGDWRNVSGGSQIPALLTLARNIPEFSSQGVSLLLLLLAK